MLSERQVHRLAVDKELLVRTCRRARVRVGTKTRSFRPHHPLPCVSGRHDNAHHFVGKLGGEVVGSLHAWDRCQFYDVEQ